MSTNWSKAEQGPYLVAFGDVIHARRHALGLSRTKVAEACGKGISTWTAYERGYSQPSIYDFRVIAVALNMTPTDLHAAVEARYERGKLL